MANREKKSQVSFIRAIIYILYNANREFKAYDTQKMFDGKLLPRFS